MSIQPKSIEQERKNSIQQNVKKQIKHVKKFRQLEEKDQLTRIYRAFRRKKQLKFRHQYNPRMTQTEIVNKIIREWQSMSIEEKLNLGDSYHQKDMYDSQDDESGNEKRRHGIDSDSEEQKLNSNETKNKDSHPILLQKNQKETKCTKQFKITNDKITKNAKNTKSTTNKIFQSKPTTSQQIKMQKIKVQESEDEQQEVELNLLQQQNKDDLKSEQQNSQPNSQSLSLSQSPSKWGTKVKKQGKGKKIKKRKIKDFKQYMKLQNGNYLMFFKHYHARLHNAHPKWSSNQITYIIKLLWRKKKQQQHKNKLKAKKQQKINKKQHVNPPKLKRPISGKQYFACQKIKQHLTKQTISLLWKQLPRQSRNDWNKRGSQLRAIRVQSKDISNLKTQPLAKTQSNVKKSKVVVTFRDLLLKGSRPVKQDIPKGNSILEQKDQVSKRQTLVKKQKNIDKNNQQNVGQKKQDIKYVSLQGNPFNFMNKKINNSIVLE